jgi:hypothetical protein
MKPSYAILSKGYLSSPLKLTQVKDFKNNPRFR